MNDTNPVLSRQRPAGSVGRTRDAGRDRLILDAVLELLGERGPSGLTMEAVAAKAGVGKSTVYRRWGRMNDLLADAVDTVTFSAGDEPQTGNVRDDLVEAIIGATGCMDPRRQQLISSLLAASNQDPDLVDALTVRFHGALGAAVDGVLSFAAMDAGLARATSEIDRATVVGLLSSLPQVTGRPLGRPDFERIVDEALVPLLRARGSRS